MPPSDEWSFAAGDSGPLLATAIHNGHRLRTTLSTKTALSEPDRLREEDPFTGLIASRFPTHVVADVSRFEVDLNRARASAVYREPEDAWGLNLWKQPLQASDVAASLATYDRFYQMVGGLIETSIAKHGLFVVYDIHSYNHRRNGANTPPERSGDNPDVNLGTGSLPPKWRNVADVFISEMADSDTDVRENVKFQGGHLSTWVHQNFGERGCALAIEFKKTFMDEWTGVPDEPIIDMLGAKLLATVQPVMEAASSV